ncbi:zinc-binding dehydrogenase [Jatrophihabitans endophyticus]|uniref:zinc-binding dehydrogenase n=1 Tax=Jatrophihabitans endophyticus TaxID=1206085 RepID=UPI00093510DD|nr:zinc-binding dehydrogenase [Jatrophihabitans endophyticus]
MRPTTSGWWPNGWGPQTGYGASFTSAAVLAELGGPVADGGLVVPIAATYPLDRVRDAYDRLAQGRTRGRMVLQVG